MATCTGLHADGHAKGEVLMSSGRPAAAGIVVAAILVLALLCIFGAFLGAQRARDFFNSPPLALLWAAVATFLVASLARYKRLTHDVGLLAAHIGVVLILGGAFVGSRLANDAAAHFLGSSKILTGRMVVSEGGADNAVFDDMLTREVGRLPFAVHLKRLTVETYEAPQGFVAASSLALPARAAAPAVKSFRSDVVLLDGGETPVEGSITVNHPLHYGGYHLYQYACGTTGRPYTVLAVASDSGLTLVYAGLAALCLGTFYWSWSGRISHSELRGRSNGA